MLAAALIDAGFDVVGVDTSAGLLEAAAREARGARLMCGSLYEVELPRCEAILAVGEGITYHADAGSADGRLRELFGRAAAALPKGGLLIFDLIVRGAPSLAGRSWSSGDDWAVMVETVEDQEAWTLLRRIETFRQVGGAYRRGREEHRVRVFDAGEVVEWLTEAGFAVEAAEAYGAAALLPRRRAFVCVRTSAASCTRSSRRRDRGRS